MALLTTHGSTNKVQHEGVSHTLIKTLVRVGRLSLWYVEEIETQSYSYIGMTKAAALTCAAAEEALWTIIKGIPSVADGIITVTYAAELVASVRPVHVACRMWQVDVNVFDKSVTLEAIGS